VASIPLVHRAMRSIRFHAGLLRAHGPKGNIEYIRQRFFRPAGMFSNGIRTTIDGGRAADWVRRRRRTVVVVALGTTARADLVDWAATMSRRFAIVLAVPSADPVLAAPRPVEVVSLSSPVGGSTRLAEVIQALPPRLRRADLLLSSLDVELPRERDLTQLAYVAHRYERALGGRISAVTPELLAADGRRALGFEWDRGSRTWALPPVGRDYGQSAIPRYVLAAPLAGLYIVGQAVPDLAADDPTLDRFIETCWRRGWWTLAFPGVVVEAGASVIEPPLTTPDDVAWLANREVATEDGRLRIVYVLPATTISGGIRTVFEQTTELRRRGHDVEIWSLQGPPDWIESETPVRSFRSYARLLAALTEVDAIKVATWWESALVVCLASARRGIAVNYVQEFETWFYPDDVVGQAAVVSSYRSQMDQITIADYQRDELAEVGIPATTISSAYDSSKFRVLPEIERETDTVLAVGRSFFQKNLAMTLRAWDLLGDKRPRMLMFGFEPELATDPLQEYVVRPDDAGVNLLYNRATCFVQTSHHEGFCLPIIEAMAAGCPVITTDSHGNRDFCVPEVNCLMVEHDDEALAAAISRLLGDRELQKRLRAAGLETARRHTWTVIVDELEARFTMLAEEASA